MSGDREPRVGHGADDDGRDGSATRRLRAEADLDRLDFAKGGGRVVVVTQDATTGAVLMTAFAERDALARTLATGEMHYTSRTRGLWHKGATSGNTQRVVSLETDCDGDAILARVVPAGSACHEGTTSCFRDTAIAADALGRLDATLAARAATLTDEPGVQGERASWTQRLLRDRNLRHKKLGEEAVELTMACLDGDRQRVTEEAADLVYHTLVAARAAGVTLDDIRAELAARAR